MPATAAMCWFRGADARLAVASARFREYARRYHTTTTQLAELANQAKPKLLVLYHASIAWRRRGHAAVEARGTVAGDDERYRGHVVVGRDLDVY